MKIENWGGGEVAVAVAEEGEDVLALWADMRTRWARGERKPAEDYLRDRPDRDLLAVDMAYAEYVVREELGEALDAGEFERRFPLQRTAIARQIALHQALSCQSEPVAPAFAETINIDNSGNAFEAIPIDRADTETKSADIACPGLLGKYFLISRLGEGGQARVYRAVHPTLERDLAIKIAFRPVGPNSRQATSLIDEARAFAQLDHPNLGRIHDLDFHAGRPYLVMEYIRGWHLAAWAKQHRPTPVKSAAIVAKLARGLATAHAQGIIHRDVKPKNIVVDPRGEPRLIDFGLASRRDVWSPEEERTEEISGTVQFMAPEQAQPGGAPIDPRADIFALGGVLYFLLTKRPPFAGPNFAVAIERARKGAWKRGALLQHGTPARLRAICEKAMATDPDDRFSSGEEFAASLEEFIESPGRWLTRSAGIGLLACLLAVVVGIGTWFAISPNAHSVPEPEPVSKSQPREIAHKGPSLSLQVWESERYLNLAGIAPIRNGDRLRVRTEIPPQLHATLFLITSEGELKELARFAPLTERRTVEYPASGQQAVPMIGPPGTEVLFVTGSRDAPLTAEMLSSLVDGRSWPTLPGATVLRIDEREVRFEQRSRGFGPPVDQPNPIDVVLARSERLRRILAEHSEFFEGLVFSHVR